jgi:hypothetical protein
VDRLRVVAYCAVAANTQRPEFCSRSGAHREIKYRGSNEKMKKDCLSGNIAVVLSLCSVFACSSAAAGTATVLGVSKSWTAYTSGSGDGKVCYAMSQPKASLPKKAKRDAVGFLINDWPSRKTRGEPEVVPGYKFKDGSTVTVEVGADKFTLSTTNDGGTGSAWVKGSNDEARLIDSMQHNGQAVVTGTSARGTLTHDTYALDGLPDALTKIHTACSL